MRQAAKPTDRRRRPTEQPPAAEPARFLRNLTSLPDPDFASTNSPAIAAAIAGYSELPDPAAASRALLLALKAALKRRRAFILPRFTQAEDSWRIRECASYDVAVAVLVEHAYAVLAPYRDDTPADPDLWRRFLADPTAQPDASSPHAALFLAIVPAKGRRWIAGEPLVRIDEFDIAAGALLDELPRHASFDNLDKVFEGLVSLRPRLLTALRRACRSVKVRRLYFVFADRHRHARRKHVDASAVDFGSGPRALVDGGRSHPAYRISVPETLMAVAGDSDARHIPGTGPPAAEQSAGTSA